MADNKNLQPASVIAKIYGTDERRIGQLKKAGVIKGEGRPAMYDLIPTIMALFRYQRSIIQNKEKDQQTADLEKEKLQAEVAVKQAKAKTAELALEELEGKMHRAEDVEQIFTGHVLFLRSMLMAMPGKLAVDMAGTHTAAEQAEVLKKEIYYILNNLADYRYDPEEYRRLVKERQGWDHREDDEDGS